VAVAVNVCVTVTVGLGQHVLLSSSSSSATAVGVSMNIEIRIAVRNPVILVPIAEPRPSLRRRYPPVGRFWFIGFSRSWKVTCASHDQGSTECFTVRARLLTG
jgi:hypothetical protein